MKKIRPYIMPAILTFCSFYFLFLAVTLRINAEAEAQTCFLMPHFYRYDDGNVTNTEHEWPNHDDHNSFCGLRVVQVNNVNDTGITKCEVYLGGNPLRWKLRAYPSGGGTANCYFVCMGWN
jgi:hypothetical protein